MARLMRDDLFEIAKKHGYVPGKVLDNFQRVAIETELKQALQAADLAPTRVFEADGSFRPMRLEEAVDNLIEELV